MKLINADELELDTEWSEYYDGFTSYSQCQINEAEEVKAIPLDEVKQARQEIQSLDGRYVIGDYAIYGDNIPRYLRENEVLEILDRLIEEVEE